MNRRVKKLLKNFILFLGLLGMGCLVDNLPDALWSLVIQIAVYSIALLVGVRIITSVNRDISNNNREEE